MINLWFGYIQTGKFYQVKEDWEWSNSWYCGDPKCGCWQLEDILEINPNIEKRLVPFYIKFSFNSVSGEYILLSLVLWFIFWYLIK